MRLFQSNLPNEQSIPPAVDGGECIHLTPDASGGDVGKGFTITGLFFDSWQPNGNPRFWAGNDGRDREPGAGGIDPQDFKPSIVLLELDYSGSDNNPPGSVYAIKKRELLTETLNKGTVQGVIKANDGTIWFISFANIININATPNGIATEISRFTVSGANGLAYDEINNELLIKVNTSTEIQRWSVTGVLVNANEITVSVNIDQLYFDSSTQILYGGLGLNGGPATMRGYNLNTGLEVSNSPYGSYPNVQASEGISVVKRGNDDLYLYYASDGWYHHPPITNPDLQINAIFKISFTP